MTQLTHGKNCSNKAASLQSELCNAYSVQCAMLTVCIVQCRKCRVRIRAKYKFYCKAYRIVFLLVVFVRRWLVYYCVLWHSCCWLILVHVPYPDFSDCAVL